MASSFPGFTKEAFSFYEGLEDDNSKAYWLSHKATFDVNVKSAMEAFLASLPESYHPFHVFRPNRDVRFAKDKSPYKTMHGASSETDGGSIRYTHVAAGGLLVAAGQYMMQNDQIARARAAIDDDTTGKELVKLVAALVKKGYQVGPGGNPPLKTTPKGYPADHPRIELLRWKGLIASTDITNKTVLTSPKVRDEAMAFWKASLPLLHWLDTNVGPTTVVYQR